MLIFVFLLLTSPDQATDKDSGNNSAIRYSIVGGDPLNNFTINNVSGEVKNAGAPDFETTEHFSIVIMAADLGSPSRNTTETLLIKVNVSLHENCMARPLTRGDSSLYKLVSDKLRHIYTVFNLALAIRKYNDFH